MNRHDAYSLVCRELAEWQRLGFAKLSTFIGGPATQKSIQIGDEEIAVEIRIHEVPGDPRAIRVEAKALGPSWYRLERLEESVTIRASDDGAYFPDDA